MGTLTRSLCAVLAVFGMPALAQQAKVYSSVSDIGLLYRPVPAELRTQTGEFRPGDWYFPARGEFYTDCAAATKVHADFGDPSTRGGELWAIVKFKELTTYTTRWSYNRDFLLNILVRFEVEGDPERKVVYLPVMKRDLTIQGEFPGADTVWAVTSERPFTTAVQRFDGVIRNIDVSLCTIAPYSSATLGSIELRLRDR